MNDKNNEDLICELLIRLESRLEDYDITKELMKKQDRIVAEKVKELNRVILSFGQHMQLIIDALTNTK